MTPLQEGLVRSLRKSGIKDERVLKVLATLPRHHFIPDEDQERAYANIPLPIGHGQTISQPYIVALMTELLELKETDTVLEIGTGSGYQTAVLAELAQEVYTIEALPPLSIKAEDILSTLGYKNIYFLVGDGYFGWEEKAPFDAIMVTAAPAKIPPPLQEQLADGGRLVIPEGAPDSIQTLWKYRKQGNSLTRENMGLVRFVPFI